MRTSAVSTIIATEKKSAISVENVRENFECHSNLSVIYKQ